MQRWQGAEYEVLRAAGALQIFGDTHDLALAQDAIIRCIASCATRIIDKVWNIN